MAVLQPPAPAMQDLDVKLLVPAARSPCTQNMPMTPPDLLHETALTGSVPLTTDSRRRSAVQCGAAAHLPLLLLDRPAHRDEARAYLDLSGGHAWVSVLRAGSVSATTRPTACRPGR